MAEIIDVVMRLTDHVTDGLHHIRTEMEQTARANSQMGRNLENAGKGVGALSSAMMPLAAGIAGVGAVGVKTFMDFDATITGAGVKAGATAEEMQKMKDAASQMGAQFPTTARDVAEGMDRLAAGGFNAEQTIGAMPGIIEASIASGEDLATTSDVVTSALSIWSMTEGDVAANTVHVADVVQAAANASKLGMADFGLAMQYAGAPAAALGVSIEELGTAMGIMSNNGIEASTIGTSLRSTLSRLASPPKEAAEALDRLGISSADLQKGDGSFIGLSGAVDLLRGKMEGLSDVQQVAALKAIAGEDAYSGLLALVKTSPEAYQQMADAITNSSGSSHEAYVKMQDTLKGSVDALMSSVEALGISFGSALAPTIRSAADGLKGIADAFTGMSPAARSMVIDVAAAVMAFTGLTFAISKGLTIAGGFMTTYGQIGRVLAGHAIRNKALQYSIQGVVRGFGLLRTAGLAMMGPVGLVVAAIALGAVVIYKNWDKLGPFFAKLWGTVTGAFSSAAAKFAPIFARVQSAWGTLTASFTNGVGVFGVLNAISDVLAGVLGGVLYGAIVAVAGVVSGVLVGAFGIVSSIVSAQIGVLGGLIDFITGVFTGDWALAWSGVASIFTSIWDGIKGVGEGVLNGIKAMINGVIGGLNSISVDIPSWVPEYGGQHFGVNIPYLAHGTDDWGGGPAVINEKGGEIVDLPSGSRVIPHDQSVRAAYNMGAAARRGDIHINISGVTITNGQDVKDFARQIAAQIQYEMEKEAINSTMGAI